MPAHAIDPILSIRNLAVEFSTRNGTVRALDRVDMDLAEGETLALLGESGSGKSVSALTIMGLLPSPAGRVTEGQIFFRGTDLLSQSNEYRRRLRGETIAMVFQDPLSSLNPVLRVGHQIAEMFRRHRGASRAEANGRAVELMRRVGIPDPQNRASDYPHQFSGGMRQRAMIAMALSLDPTLLIADEPTTALDVTVQAQIMELLAELQNERRMSMILISHDLGVVADAASRVAVMYAGQVVETGPIRSVYERPTHPYTLGLMQSLPRLEASGDRLTPILGSPPDMLNVPRGCPFHPRCPFAKHICTEEAPPLLPVHNGHSNMRQQLSACHFKEEVIEHGRAGEDSTTRGA